VLSHEPKAASLAWEGGGLFGVGCYVMKIQSKHAARQEIRLRPHPDDWARAWEKQRVRVLEVTVEQSGVPLYRAMMDDYQGARRALPREDPDGLEPAILPSGPECTAEVPRRIRLEVPGSDQDLILSTLGGREARLHNPPVTTGLFHQRAPGGVRSRYSECND